MQEKLATTTLMGCWRITLESAESRPAVRQAIRVKRQLIDIYERLLEEKKAYAQVGLLLFDKTGLKRRGT